MGMAVTLVYTMFIINPLKKLGQVARETFGTRANSDFYYLAVGLPSIAPGLYGFQLLRVGRVSLVRLLPGWLRGLFAPAL